MRKRTQPLLVGPLFDLALAQQQQHCKITAIVCGRQLTPVLLATEPVCQNLRPTLPGPQEHFTQYNAPSSETLKHPQKFRQDNQSPNLESNTEYYVYKAEVLVTERRRSVQSPM